MTHTPEGPRRRWQVWIWLGAGALALLGVAGYLLSRNGRVMASYHELVRFFSSRKQVRAFVQRFGAYAPLAFILLQALQVVLSPIPGEATGFLGGFLFGTGLGFLYSSIGLSLGSAAAFGLGRWLGLPLVRRLVSETTYHRFDGLARTGGELLTLVLFLIPGFPKDILCFLLGVSPQPFGTFLVITTFGRMPGTWLLSIQGAKVRDAHYGDFAVLLTIAAGAAFLAYQYRDALHRWVHRQQHKPPAPRGPEGR
ncbi:MAG: TVP38/TMEM64 family protein [Candidatus Methylomirabilales bacterium]